MTEAISPHNPWIEWLADIEAWRRERREALDGLMGSLAAQNRLLDDYCETIAARRGDSRASRADHGRHAQLGERHRRLMAAFDDICLLLESGDRRGTE